MTREMLKLVGEANFKRSTLNAIEAFKKGKEKLTEKWPSITAENIRSFLMGDYSIAIPEEMKEEIENLNDIRKDAIKTEMHYAKASARLDGIQLPEQYISGEALDVFFAPETYRYYGFRVFQFFSWYEPWEETQLLAGKLFSI